MVEVNNMIKHRRTLSSNVVCSHRVKDVLSVALEVVYCDCKCRHLSEFDWGSLQLLLCVIGIVRGADLGGRVKGGEDGGGVGGQMGEV